MGRVIRVVRGGSSVLTRFVSTSVGSTVTSLLALIVARFPTLLGPLHVMLPVGGGVSTASTLGPKVAARRAYRGLHSHWKMTALAIGASALMVASGIYAGPTMFLAPASLPDHSTVTPLPNATTPFFPYIVPAADYPQPMSLTLNGSVSLPQMIATTDAGLPTLHLLAVLTDNSTARPVLLTGEYSESLAREIQDGNGCPSGKGGHGKPAAPCPPPSIALTWSSPTPLDAQGTTIVLAAPVSADAFALDGSLWAIALTSSGTTSLWTSNDAGSNWTLAASGLQGDSPQLAVAYGLVTMVVQTSGSLSVTMVKSDGSVVSNTLSSAPLHASTVILPPPTTGSNPAIGIVVVLQDGSVVFQRSGDLGATWSNVTIGNAPLNSTSPIFNQIGDTSLSVPGETPGQVTAVSSGNTTWVLWSASISGKVMAVTAVSPNAGDNWSGPYVQAGNLVSLSDPQAILTPAGYVLVSWRDTTGEVDLQPYGLDGRALSGALPVSPPGAGGAVTGPALAVDGLERPFFAWVSASNTTLEVTGALLHAPQAVENWLDAVRHLQSDDFANGTNTSQSALESKLGALLNMVSGPGGSTGAIEKVEQDIVPKVTNLPLELGCSGANNVCGHVHHGQDSAWILNESGPMAANTYLAIYGDWVLESLGVTVFTPPPGDPVNVCSPPNTLGGNQTFSCPVEWAPSGYSSASGSAGFGVGSILLDPLTDKLTTSANLPTLTVEGTIDFTCGGKTDTTDVNLSAVPTSVTFVLSTSAGNVSQTLAGNGEATFYLRNLPSNQATTYTVSITATYFVKQFSGRIPNPYGGYCDVFTNAPAPSDATLTASMQVDPVEQLSPNPPVMVETACSVCVSNYTITLNATVTMPSELFANATSSTQTISLSTGVYQRAINTTQTGFSATSYTMMGDAQSEPGNSSATVSGIPAGAYQIYQRLGVSGSNPLTSSFSCSFTVVSSTLGVTNLAVTGITETTADVSWDTNTATGSIVELQEVGIGAPTYSSVSGTSTHHMVPLTGLSPFALYSVSTISRTSPNTGCLVVQVTTPIESFQTNASFELEEYDLPYDSVTKEGGGASLSWNVPTEIVKVANLISGYISYAEHGGTGSPTVVPIVGGQSIKTADLGWFQDTLSLLTLNATYSVRIVLNFTYNLTLPGMNCAPCTLAAQNQPFNFTYLQDTAGSGLTNSEKTYGWPMSWTDTQGTPQLTYVEGWWNRYSTNGLVSDYVEKEFGLNPGTIDSAGSHMLDTWNLTFDLGSNGLPSGIRAWYEDTGHNPALSNSFNPFGASPAPGVPSPGGNPIGQNWTNLSSIRTAGDNHPWASEVLWDYNSLLYLNGLVFSDISYGQNTGWLRAVTGSWKGQNTLTVWGKLSWGANPLATSTPGDGIADGARLNPLYELDLQLTAVNGLLYHPGGCQVPTGLSSGDGFALRMYLNQTSASGSNEFQGFTSTGFVGCPPPNDPSGQPLPEGVAATWTLPVNNQVQTQNLALQMLLNTSTCASDNSCQKGVAGPFELLPIEGCSLSYAIGIDMLNPPPSYENFVATGSDNCPNEPPAPVLVSFFAGVVPVQTKVPTYLWTPNDNSTLSNLPTGLQRYTGEQDFFLVVANISTSSGTASSATIPYPGSGSYHIDLADIQGNQLVNFLIPRDQFLVSPLGQEVLQNKQAASPGNGKDNVQIWDSSMDSLACYWAASAYGGCGAFTAPPLGAYSPESNSNGATPLNCTNSPGAPNCAAGGVPSDPYLEQGNEAPSLQAVMTFNLTSDYDLNALLAGLLDNTTGSVNGSFQQVTNELPSLGLNPTIMGALANMVYPSTGLFGLPISLAQPPPPPPSSCSGWGCVWNSVSGAFVALGQTIVQGLVGLAGDVWNGFVAAGVFFDHIGEGLKSLAENAVAATVSALKAVGHLLEAALQALLTFVYNEITSLLQKAFAPIQAAFTQYWRSVETPSSQAENQTSGGTTPSNTLLTSIWANMSSGLFMDTLVISSVLLTVLGVLLSLNVGADFLVPILTTVIITIALSFTPLGTIISDLTSSFATLDANSVTGLESWIGSHPQVAASEPHIQSSSPSGGWETAISATSLLASLGFGFPLSMKELSDCLYVNVESCSVLAIGISFTLEFFSLGLHFAKLFTPIPLSLSIIGLLLGLISTITMSVKVLHEEAGGLKLLMAVLAVIGGISVGANLYSVYKAVG